MLPENQNLTETGKEKNSCSEKLELAGIDPKIISSLTKVYENELFEKVIPFWEKYSPDKDNGGYFNCLDRDGWVYDNAKYIWLQARQVFIFSKLYRDVEPCQRWLDLARSGAVFLRNNARREDGRVYFSLNAQGAPLSLQRKIFSECFYIMAFAEFGRASGEPEWLKLAREQFALVWEWAFDLTKVGRPVYSGETATRNLAIPMILLNLIEVLGDGDVEEYRVQIDDCVNGMLKHVHRDEEVVFENVGLDGEFINSSVGRHLNPGHAIEAGWFLQHWAQRLKRRDLSETAVDMVRWSHDRGWDQEFGGLFYFLDYLDYSPTQLEWNMKLWWPHCEALYGHLLNFSVTGDKEDWERFKTVHDYSFAHFPDPEFGEWYGYLDRRGEVTHRFKGGPYKGCFHVPRALWLVWRLLKRLKC